jgi:hypothetical protein
LQVILSSTPYADATHHTDADATIARVVRGGGVWTVRGNVQGNDHESLTGEGPVLALVWVDVVLEPTKLTPFH